LDATCVHVGHSRPKDGVASLAYDGDKAQVAYLRDGALHRVEARHAVLACFHMMIPHIAPGLPAPQRAALARNVKTPICYTNVLVRNWQAFKNLKVSSISAPMGFHNPAAPYFPAIPAGL